MRPIQIHLSDHRASDEAIDHSISIERLQHAFCFKLARRDGRATFDLGPDCIDAPNVTLMSFVDDRPLVEDMQRVWDLVASKYLDFLQLQHGGTARTLTNAPELRRYIVQSCQKNWRRNYAHFTRTASCCAADKREYNLACGKLLRAVLRKAAVRFRTCQYEHTYAIPFCVGDVIHFECTVRSHVAVRRYDIRLTVST